MSVIDTCAKLAAYLLCIGLALEGSHRLYWRLSKQLVAMQVSSFARSVLGIAAACIPLATAIGITAAFMVFVNKQSLSTLGLDYDGMSLTHIAYGAALALCCVTVVYLIGILFGFIEVRRSQISDDCVSCLPMFLGGLIDFFTGSVFEEIIFRGYVFHLLFLAAGSEVAITGSAVIFSLAHVAKHPKIPVLYIFNAIIFGVLAGACRHYTGSLWLPIGLHFGWNVVSGPLFGLPFSGKSYERGVVISDVSGPSWFTGGLYSLDAGVLGTIALAIAAAGLMVITPS